MYSLPHLFSVEVNDRLLNSIMPWQIQACGGLQQGKNRFYQSEQF